MSGIGQIIRDDLRRNRKHFLLSSVGIVVGIAAFAFFLSLGVGVRAVVLGEIFPLDKLEVVPKVMDFDVGPLRMGMGKEELDDEVAEQLREIPHVDAVYPKMKLTVPSIGKGGASILGNDLYTEMIADGIEPELIEPDVKSKYTFAYVHPKTPEEEAALPPCSSEDDCGEHRWCRFASQKNPRKGAADDGETGQCRPYIPVVASPHLVELYNGTLRRAHDFPKLNPDFVVGLTFDLYVGESMVRGSEKSEVRHEKCQLVGFSTKAISIGATMPLGYVQELNSRYGNEDDATRYHSIIVRVDAKDQVAGVAKAVQDLGFEVADSGAEQAAMLIAIFMAVFGLISVVIVGIAAINIMHVFFMLIYERQRELGIMRAVGANRAHIRRIIIGEAAIVGLCAGLVGVGISMGGAWLFDWIAANYVPDFPYKPETFFSFHPVILGSALAFAVGFCVLGAALPANRAARMDPVVVLTAH